MTKLPIIAIPCHYGRSSNYIKAPINGQYNTYIDAVVAAGGTPFLIPLQVDDTQLRALYDLADGLLLTGGGDIDPATYHEIPDDTVSNVQPDRDRVEITLTRWAIAEKKPVLGICRGFQVMTVAAGGSLHQNIATQVPQANRHDYLPVKGDWPRNYRAHQVSLNPDSQLAKITGKNACVVNSLHHQGLKTINNRFQIVGYAEDGLPEAIELPENPFCIGVQWHPEELVTDDPARRLFAAFVDACRHNGDHERGK